MGDDGRPGVPWPALVRSLVPVPPTPVPITADERAALEAMGERLRQLREYAQLTRREAADLAGISDVGALERADHRPRRALAERLARALAEVVVADVLEPCAGIFAPPSTFPGEPARKERQRDAKAVSVAVIRRRRQLRIAAETGDYETLASQLEPRPFSSTLAREFRARLAGHPSTQVNGDADADTET